MKKAKSRRRKIISYVARVAVGLVALYLVFRGEDITELLEVLLSIRPAVFAGALAVYLLSQFAVVLRWFSLLKVQGIGVGLWAATKLYAMALFYNNVLPTSFGGDFVKAWYLTHYTDKKFEAVLSVFVDRVLGVGGILIMAVLAYWLIPADVHLAEREDIAAGARSMLEQLGQYRHIFQAGVLMFVAGVALLVLTRRGRALLGRAWRFIRLKGLGFLSRVHTSMLLYYNQKAVLLVAMALSLTCQGLFVLSLWIIGNQLEAGVSVRYYFIIFPLSWFLGALPVSVGGLGIMEGWVKLMLVRVAGATGRMALVLAVCQRLFILFGSIPGALIHLFGAHLPREFFIDADESIK